MAKKATARKTYTDAQKARVLAYADKHSVAAASEKYSVTQNTVYNWKNKAGETAQASKPEKAKPARKTRKGRKPRAARSASNGQEAQDVRQAPTARQRAVLDLFQQGWSVYLLHDAFGVDEKAVQDLLREALRSAA